MLNNNIDRKSKHEQPILLAWLPHLGTAIWYTVLLLLILKLILHIIVINNDGVTANGNIWQSNNELR